LPKNLGVFFKSPTLFPLEKATECFAALSSPPFQQSLQEEKIQRKKGQNGVGCGCQNGTKDESRRRILLTLLFITIYRKFTKGQSAVLSSVNRQLFSSMP